MVAPYGPEPMLDSEGNQVTIMGFPCVLVDFTPMLAKAEEEAKLSEAMSKLCPNDAQVVSFLGIPIKFTGTMGMQYGPQDDGGFYLPPKATAALSELMLHRNGGPIVLAEHPAVVYLRKFADVLYEECGIEFEVYT